VAIDAVDAVGDDADAADEHARLVQRQPAGVGGETERRAFRSGAGGARDAHDIRAGERRELNAKERAARRVGVAGIEVLLDDLAGGARAEGVAFGGQVGGGQRLAERRQLGRYRGTFETAGNRAAGRNRGGGRGTRHAKDGECIADAIDHRDARRRIARLSLVDRLAHDGLDLEGAERGRRRRAARAAAAAVIATATAASGEQPAASEARGDAMAHSGACASSRQGLVPPWKRWQLAQSDATFGAVAAAPPWHSRQRAISGMAMSSARREVRTSWQV